MPSKTRKRNAKEVMRIKRTREAGASTSEAANSEAGASISEAANTSKKSRDVCAKARPDQPCSSNQTQFEQELAENEQGTLNILSTDSESDNEHCVGVSQHAAVTKRGRPQKLHLNGPGRRCLPTRASKISTTPLTFKNKLGRGGRPSLTPRRSKLNEKHMQHLEEENASLLANYIKQSWPLKPKYKRLWTRCCRGRCDCVSFEQCQQNAQAYVAAVQYNKAHAPPTIHPKKLKKLTPQCHTKHHCASAVANHRVDYYDCGQFGAERCQHCGALQLRNEATAVKQGRHSHCCSNGQCHTEQMKADYAELQSPPNLFKELIEGRDEQLREEFLNNTMPLNNTFAFASVHSEKAPDDQMAGRKDTVKYNGEYSFQFSDLKAVQGRRPTFAQVYTLMPEDAQQLRSESINAVLQKQIKREIVEALEQLMRANPYGQAFTTAGAKIAEAAMKNRGELPLFRIVLLTDRDMNTDAFKNREDCTLIERTDAPTAKQVAVIWVQEDGLAPEINGFWVCDKAGKMRELKSGMPQLDPCCFPLLHPKGTPGWRWFIKKQNTVLQGHHLNKGLSGTSVTDVHLDAAGAEEIEHVEQEIHQEEDTLFDWGIDEQQGEQNQLDDVVDAADCVIEGEDAEAQWPKKDKKKSGPEENISERQFYRYRIALREASRGAFHWLWYARRLAEFFVIAALNRIERNEMNHLKAQQMKKNYRHILARDFVFALEQGLQRQGQNAKLGKIFLMPQTFAGSRQYYQKKYADLMTLVRHLGNPTWFVTFTGNPNWPEITAALQGRQQYTHRADIVCRIFMDKATEFIKDVVERNVLGKVVGWCYSVEHQKRGMPHIHMLLILKKQGRITTPDQVDQFVNARIPALPPADDLTPEANQQRRLWNYVTTMMLHDCNAACLDASEIGKPRCRKHFPKPYSDRTELSEVRYTNYIRLPAEHADAELYAGAPTEMQELPINDHLLPEDDPARDWNEIRYQRIPCEARVLQGPAPERTFEHCGLSYIKKIKRGKAFLQMDDSRVIPYNSALLLKYGCHINVEYVFGQKACKYIFKYLLKGFEKAFVKVLQPRRGANSEDPELYDYDEIAATFKVRYMTAMEAYLRMHSYKIVRLSHQVYSLSIHDELGQTIVIEEGHEEQGRNKINAHTRLTAFFELCSSDPEACDLTYDRVPYRFYWNQKQRQWARRKRPLASEPEEARMFVRVYTVSPKRHELFAIRALLLHKKGPKSFKDLRTVDGYEHPTFVEAAIRLRLLESDEIYAGAMRDACDDTMNLNRLQHYFAMLIFHSRPSDPQTLFDNFLDQMRPHRASVDCDDVIRSKESRRGEVMQNIEYYFNCMDTSCSAMGLRGLPNNYSFEHQAQQLSEASMMDGFYGNEDRQRKTLQQVAVQGAHRLNSDQRKAFNCVTDAISGRGEERYFFIEGAGGCGKTFLYNTLIRWCLAGKPTLEDVHLRQGRNTVLQSGSVISAASTGIAALLLLGGGTVHRQFSVPNDINDNTPPQVSFESARARQLRAVDLIIIDEISMLSNKVLRYIDRVLRDVCAENKPFGGKVIVLGGDWKQLTPVVEHGTREDQVQESIKIDPLFVDNFKQLSLTVNMRTAPAQEALRQWLLQIGNGFHQAASGDQQGHKAKQLPIPKELVSANLTEIIDFCFPAAMFEDPKSHGKIIKNNAILCPTNIDVQVINDAAMEKVAGAAVTYLSIDEPLEPQEEFGTFRSDFNLEAINNETPSGMPPHKLILKEGAPVMLIRNLDITSGLCNGTRMQIDHMTDANLYCRLLTGPREGQEYIIPRVKFEYGQGRYHRGLRFRRIQFPVRPCFAMTVNKAQGQTLQKMGLVLSGRQCFSHGQVYVAMSRVTTLEGIRVFSPYTSRGEDMFINNVVFHELLNDASIPPRHLLEAIDKPNAVTDLAEDSDIDFQELDLPC